MAKQNPVFLVVSHPSMAENKLKALETAPSEAPTFPFSLWGFPSGSKISISTQLLFEKYDDHHGQRQTQTGISKVLSG